MRYLIKNIQMKDKNEFRDVHRRMLNSTCELDTSPIINERLLLSLDEHYDVRTSTVLSVTEVNKDMIIETHNTIYTLERIEE